MAGSAADRPRRRAVGPPGSRRAVAEDATGLLAEDGRADDGADDLVEDDDERLLREVPPHHG